MQVTVEQSQSQRVERHVHTDVHDGVQARIRIDGIRAVSVEYVGSTRGVLVTAVPWRSVGCPARHYSLGVPCRVPLEVLVASGTRWSSR